MWPDSLPLLPHSFIGEFNGVVYEVCDDLPESPKVSDKPAWHAWLEPDRQFDFFLFSGDSEKVDNIIDCSVNIEFNEV